LVLFDHQQLDDVKRRDYIPHDHVYLNENLHVLYEKLFLYDEQKHHVALNKKYLEVVSDEVKEAKERPVLA